MALLTEKRFIVNGQTLCKQVNRKLNWGKEDPGNKNKNHKHVLVLFLPSDIELNVCAFIPEHSQTAKLKAERLQGRLQSGGMDPVVCVDPVMCVGPIVCVHQPPVLTDTPR